MGRPRQATARKPEFERRPWPGGSGRRRSRGNGIAPRQWDNSPGQRFTPGESAGARGACEDVILNPVGCRIRQIARPVVDDGSEHVGGSSVESGGPEQRQLEPVRVLVAAAGGGSIRRVTSRFTHSRGLW